MKAVLLAGGSGTRLAPMTEVTNKHLLPVFNKPMIFWPMQTLLDCGCRDILVISGPDHLGSLTQLLGSGARCNARFTYRVQDTPNGIAAALALAEDFVGAEPFAVILGDSIFEKSPTKEVRAFKSGAHIFISKVKDPHRFGVVELSGKKVTRITEKPKTPKTHWVQTGLYLFDSEVFSIIRSQTPSRRKELEITDTTNAYLKRGQLTASKIKGFWRDAGTVPTLLEASTLAAKYAKAV